MIIGLGSDLCNIERIQNSLDRFGERFELRVFTEIERAKARRRPLTTAATYAKRFAAKEAFSKAVGTGFRAGVFMKDIGVVNARSGAPTLALTGGAAVRLRKHRSPGPRGDHSPHPHRRSPMGAGVCRHRGSAIMNDVTPNETESSRPRARTRASTGLGELRGLLLMLLAVLGFHSLIAKPFYIPSISMMPGLLVGDRLVVSKYPYGWNWSSVSFHLLPRGEWRVAGGTPEYGDIVIVVPRNRREDLIKRVVALPGDRIAVENGQIVLNGKPVPQEVEPALELPVDPDQPCDDYTFPGLKARMPSGREVCELPMLRETLPNGASYLVIDHLRQTLDDMDEIEVPAGHVFLMGDNRDHSADSRAMLEENGLGGPVPLHDIGGRAEFITFSLDGTQSWNPLSWWSALREGRAWTTLRPRIERPRIEKAK